MEGTGSQASYRLLSAMIAVASTVNTRVYTSEADAASRALLARLVSARPS